MKIKPVIIGLEKYSLTKNEKSLLKNFKPWGIILFKRNIYSFFQLKNLIKDIRHTVNDNNYPIMIDEEGGDVSRFSKLINSKEFSQKFFGDYFLKDKINSKVLYEFYLNSICSVFKTVGINMNTIPVLDVLQKNTHKILKNRCYSSNIKITNILGNLCINNLNKNKIGSVAKHIPGHGGASSDSHVKMPRVSKSFKQLMNKDFFVFKNIKSNFVMTAHVLYDKIDPTNVATHSDIIINKVIRQKLNYKGLIMSDDISMKALKGNLITNAKKAHRSGCNLILHCNGNIKESSLLLKSFEDIDSFTKKKTRQFYNFLR